MFHAREIMNTDIVTVSPDDTIDQALSLMLQYRITGLVVADNDDHPLGIISDFDLLEIAYDVNVEGHQVSDYMSSDLIQADETISWIEVADILKENRIRRLPITSEGKLVGIITRHDLMRAIRGVRLRARALLVTSEN